MVTEVGLISIFLIALSLSADCFAVAVSSSLTSGSFVFRRTLRVALSFGFFQALMPVLGWFAGRTIINLIAPFDHWIAFVLLAFVGGRMLWESFHSEEHKEKTDVTCGLQLLVLSLATSIDALAIGLSFAVLEVNILLASLAIGAIAFAVTITGFLLGIRAGRFIGKRAEVVGGLVLIAIGLRILFSHLLA